MRGRIPLLVSSCALGCGDDTFSSVSNLRLNAPMLDAAGPGFKESGQHYSGCEEYCRQQPKLKSLSSCTGLYPLRSRRNGDRSARGNRFRLSVSAMSGADTLVSWHDTVRVKSRGPQGPTVLTSPRPRGRPFGRLPPL
jgi:hypothetical protein